MLGNFRLLKKWSCMIRRKLLIRRKMMMLYPAAPKLSLKTSLVKTNKFRKQFQFPQLRQERTVATPLP